MRISDWSSDVCSSDLWMPLFRTRNVERSVYAEELVFVHQCMHFRFIEKDAAFLVMDECVVFPAVPKPSHRGNMLQPAPVSLVDREETLLAVIIGCPFKR